ncbi:hypothetical protein IF1G_07775 [Cordyceps javanica]|uniref:Uncharacterized protein n=1 Tax=Cordyceps javanica TaxID=43265 RepID=A0A545VUP3_9HYPO|nr:hypothetical protein IF1G_07775 [Cordyceps javanica]TQW05440.1 hypothetical protein IF2G_07377 [Cordyceps javanica]
MAEVQRCATGPYSERGFQLESTYRSGYPQRRAALKALNTLETKESHHLPTNTGIHLYLVLKMKSFVPIALALFGAALAAPVAPESVESTAKNPDILYFMPVGWGKRSAEVSVEKRSEEAAAAQPEAAAKNPDILYFMPVGWGKRSADEA